MFVLNSEISIGRFRNVKPIEVKVSKTIYSFLQTATIKLPSAARLTRFGQPDTFTETAKQFKEGEPVTIELGYNGNFKKEFTGFLSRVNLTSPVSIECEGYSYQLRKKICTGTVTKIQLREVLSTLIQGTDIALEKEIPDFLIEKLVLNGKTGISILQEIKQASANTIRFFFIDNILYAGLQFTKHFYDVTYRIGWNTIKDDNLKLREKSNDNYEVHVIGEKKDGTKEKTITAPKKNGQIHTIKTHAVTDKASLKLMGDAKLQQLSYDGYEGKITSFLQPFCEPGCRIILQDIKYPERSGNYLCDSIEVTYGNSGARRIIGLGHKL